LGAGAIGCLWAAWLSCLRVPLVVLLRDDDACARYHAADGISVTENGCTRRFRPHCEPVSFGGTLIQRLLVTTKSWQTEAAFAPLAGRLAPGAWVILLQNGMGQEDKLRALAPLANFALGTTTDGAWRLANWQVHLAGHGETLIGPVEPAHCAMLTEDCCALRDANPRVTFTAEIRAQLWRKLAVNCVINPLTAIHGCLNGDILRQPECQRLLPDLCDELATIAKARGQPLDTPELLQLVYAVATATRANRSSMLQDVLAGCRTEIEEINGYICRTGRELGIATPLNDAMLHRVRALTGHQTG